MVVALPERAPLPNRNGLSSMAAISKHQNFGPAGFRDASFSLGRYLVSKIQFILMPRTFTDKALA
jgi:hypothetical protein